MVTATVTFDGNPAVFDGTYGSVSCEFDASLAYDKNGGAGNTGDHTVQILDKTFTVNVPAPEIQYKVEKNGSADLANKCIHWTATVTATQGGTGVDLAGYRFSDELSAVGDYIKDTFKVGGSPETMTSPATGFSSDNSKLTYTFPDGSTSPQTVAFDTAIPDNEYYTTSPTDVENKAQLFDKDNQWKAEGKYTVSIQPTWIEKKGEPIYGGSSGVYDPTNRTIKWTITANQMGANLKGAYITDLLPDGLTLVSATAQTGDGSPIGTWTKVPTNGKYGLGDINTPILLTIVTSVPDATYAAEIKSYRNSAKIGWDGVPGGGIGTGGIDVGVGYNAIDKTGKLDPTTGIVTWTVTVNTTEKIPNLKVYDLLVYGDNESGFDSTDVNGIKGLTPQYNQKYIDGSFSLPAGANLTLTKTVLPKGSTDTADLLTIEGFADDASHQATFTFKTQVVNPDIFAGNKDSEVTNTASLFSANAKLNEATATVKYPSRMLAKEMLKRGSNPATADGANAKTTTAADGFDYADKSVIFRLSVNADGMDLSNMKDAGGMKLGKATVTDTLPAGWEFTEIGSGTQYLIFKGNTGSDKSVTATGDPVTVGNLTATFGTAEDGRKTAAFAFQTLDQPYVILVKAKPDDATAAGYFSTNGTVTEKNDLNLKTENWTPGVSVSQDVSITSKVLQKSLDSAKADSGELTWTVNYQPYNLPLASPSDGNMRIEDTLPAGIDLRTDSGGKLLLSDGKGNAYITVTEMSLQPDGSYRAGESVLLDDDIISYDNDGRVLTFRIPDSKHAYRLTYLTDVTGDAGTDISNTAKLIGSTQTQVEQDKAYTISDAAGRATMKRNGWITVTKTDGSGNPLPGAEFTVLTPDGNTVIRTGTTGADGAVTLRAIPGGEYILKETKAHEGYTLDGAKHTLTVSTDESGGVTASIDGKAGDGSNTITVKNYPAGTGSLTISKVVAGNAADTGKKFDFTVTFPDANGAYDYTGSGVADGTIQSGGTVSLAHGQSVTIWGLPDGASYEVKETSYAADGYSPVSTGANGAIQAPGMQTASFTNTKNTPSNPSYPVVPPTTGRLTISKAVAGTGADTAKKFNFTVTFTGADGTYSYTGNGVPGGTIQSGGTVSLAHGQSVTISGLPDGAGYRVSEQASSAEGYSVRSAGDSGTVSAAQDQTAAFTNTRLPFATGSLTIRKTVTGRNPNSAGKFRFTVVLDGAPDAYLYTGSSSGSLRSGGTVLLAGGQSVTVAGLPEGTRYTVTEDDDSKKGYTASSAGASGVISANATRTASFTNAWNAVPGTPGTDIGDTDIPHGSMDGSDGKQADAAGGMPETGDSRTGGDAKFSFFLFGALFAGFALADLALRKKRSGEKNRK